MTDSYLLDILCNPEAQELYNAFLCLRRRCSEILHFLRVCNKLLAVLEAMKAAPPEDRDAFIPETVKVQTALDGKHEIFKLIEFQNLINGELRIQSLIKARKIEDDYEQQEAKALLDIVYIEGLVVGCYRLLIIIREAKRRLERQIHSVLKGERWPVETIGSAR